MGLSFNNLTNKWFKEPIHFLHIGKTGGSAVKHTLKKIRHPKYYFILHGHHTTLRDIPEGEKVMFSLRNPITRFVSGFNSRLRKGLPRYNSEWSLDEETIFKTFGSPNLLAEALSSDIQDYREKAQAAMTKINHVNTSYSFWLEDKEYLTKRKDDIIYIMYQESLYKNFESFKVLLGISPEVNLPMDEIVAHKTPSSFDTSLSSIACENLKAWYASDINLFNFTKKLFFYER